ncbi:MAG: toprim domain-containing protein [Nitrosopumilus sp.]|nr:toprim domain-containing protein [Nitrosopumilus sp.]
MLVTEQEIHEMKKFVSQLNTMKKSVVVVEGKRDAIALRKVGFSGKILEFYKFGGIVNFADAVAKYDKLIILFDRDKKGRILTGKTIQLLQRRTKIDLSFKRRLRTITKGKIMFVEQLVCYESYLVYGHMPFCSKASTTL